MRNASLRAVLMVAVAIAPLSAQALSIGMIDTFQGGLSNWFAGGGPFGQVPPVPPHVVATGGPTGDHDAYMEVTSAGGNGPGSRLVAMNATQWAGNYATGGFATIEMDLRNLGPSDLVIRLLFEDPIPGPPENIAVTNFGAVLPSGGEWVHVAFSISAADFTALIGDVTSLLADTTLIRIIHATDVGDPTPVAGVLGVDNISAGFVPRPGPFDVPEPAPLLLLAAALATLALARRSREAHMRARAS